MSIQDIESRALQLPREERAALVRHLIASLDEADEVMQAWAEESARRSDAVRAGEVAPAPASEVFADARKALG